MKRNDYLKRAFDLYNSGKINEDTYDTMICNIDDFTDSDDTMESMSEDYFD
jgi:hypothetical protein